MVNNFSLYQKLLYFFWNWWFEIRIHVLYPLGHKKSLGQAVRRKDATPAVQDWATKACHRCLVCLGDIGKTLLMSWGGRGKEEWKLIKMELWKKCLFTFIFVSILDSGDSAQNWIIAEIAHASQWMGWLNQKILIGEWWENGCIGRLWIFPLL